MPGMLVDAESGAPVLALSSPGALSQQPEKKPAVETPAARLAHWEADLTGAVAVVVGSEQYGLSSFWLEQAGEHVLIPMPGSVDSLNAAMAAGIVLFEAVRQRAAAAPHPESAR